MLPAELHSTPVPDMHLHSLQQHRLPILEYLLQIPDQTNHVQQLYEQGKAEAHRPLQQYNYL